MRYLVKWADNVDSNDKDRYLNKLNSMSLCEFKFGDNHYAWLEFVSFPFSYDGKPIIDINGGVTPAQTQPEIDNFIFDGQAEMTDEQIRLSASCHSNFDLLAPLGSHPVSIFNLDTGVNLPICDNSVLPFDFCGNANCSIDFTAQTGNCQDFNGHGTHGLGIQQNIINQSLQKHQGVNVINIENFTVFNSEGKGNLGSILCALAEVLDDPSPRKIVNCSFSFYSEWNPKGVDPLFDAFVELASQNIFSVASAGNEGLNLDDELKSFPACYFSQDLGNYDEYLESSTICIGAATCKMNQAKYSNFSTENVDISTLGDMIGPDLESGLVKYRGTSQATFATSAIAAILMSNQKTLDLAGLKCSIISGAKIYPNFELSNKANGILSALGAYEKIILGNPCEEDTGIFDEFSSVGFDTALQFQSKQQVNTSIFPNPVSTNFTYVVDVSEEDEYSISIVSSSGKIMNQRILTLKQGQNSINFDENLETGIYFIHLEGENKMKNSRFVKL